MPEGGVTSSGNVSISDDEVLVTGYRLHCDTWDLWLDSPDRRLPSNQDGVRRALVHDFNDRLTVNYDGDYPNGVQIRGSVVVDSLFVRGAAGFAGPITAPDIRIQAAVEPPLITSVQAPPADGGVPSGGGMWGIEPLTGLIQGLQSQVQMLQEKVAALEAKLGPKGG